MLPRAVILTRPTQYRQLLRAHGTHGQARFFLEQRDRAIEPLVQADAVQQEAVKRVAQSIPADWRQARVDRSDLDRFLFEPDDVVLAVGQDGLVANAARFLTTQIVIGFNPDPAQYDGILVAHSPDSAAKMFPRALARDGVLERTMVEARLDDGSSLRALNEIFVGQPTHQSARYTLEAGDRSERHSSSGLIVASGTGCTGWARSICGERATSPALPDPWERAAVFLVREAFPSRATGTDLTGGRLEGSHLRLVSEMDTGVIFADGIESDRLGFGWGQQVEIGCSDQPLNLLEAA